ncbi:hydrogenase expression/formation protein HypC [Thermoanaerobacter thermohydrosulfuricus]|uniref:Hydrogenase assembly chaperone HypC/HupF n=4 Tax=Thermoanaerobacter TaxID=1754 RepID=I8R4J9_9THEO|nr:MULTISPECIES: HypC/HybG/HupF family hydrogenase formation chaperone [Thermoanaerobacter]HHY80731.1 HypC/HybG/HupF family hydrogenase formation chaperone [Thermoanaerobacter sp.]AEM77653.1 hydrogenase assembly chaperone hypC/hupF [Thermoanaerobacter wiegelii Rt8.B1]EIW00350.1 hydrogenase assembly chaperone HypC/HupF [Thermoanaerobacter siderophilus SR4]EMT39402.1 hydrogenase assembly chaperone HypC/HupF [Thermoanaerobacter thermohydrosulfuricus WC1]UZQ83143.1 HypC/HybG/HupF family hydrogenas
MCIAVPSKVIKIEGKVAETELGGVIRKVSIEMVPEVKVGDYVMVHAGLAISIVDKEEAEMERELWEELMEVLNDAADRND